MIEKELESVCIDITARNGKHIQIGSLYRAPNTEIVPLLDHLEMVTKMTNSKPNYKLIIGMDQNLDLLKSENHNSTQKFLDTILSNYKTHKNYTG